MHVHPDIISKYFPGLTSSQQEQFSRLKKLYTDWNEKINLVSRKDIGQLSERHILHSLSIARVIQFKPGTKILDIGTGGGFPGIPLAIVFPEARFHLVDSVGKKITVVKDIIQSLELKNSMAEQVRAEEVKEQYDFAVSRAVAPLAELVGWMKGNISKKSFNTLENGLLCLKGGDLGEEISSVKEKTKLYHLSDFFEEEFYETKKLVHVVERKI